MIKAILLDLDDTLLFNSVDTFLPRYFSLLDKHTQPFVDDNQFIDNVLAATQMVIDDTDPARSNKEVFWDAMRHRAAYDQQALERHLEQFYAIEFDQLRHLCRPVPAAVELVPACFEVGWQVVVATNPLFPRTAVEARLAWAGVPVGDYDYSLVTTLENMHATKPNLQYYREILDKIDCDAREALMVGDSWQNDIEPAAALGMYSYWIQLPDTEAADPGLPTAYGTLETLHRRLSAGWLR